MALVRTTRMARYITAPLAHMAVFSLPTALLCLALTYCVIRCAIGGHVMVPGRYLSPTIPVLCIQVRRNKMTLLHLYKHIS